MVPALVSTCRKSITVKCEENPRKPITDFNTFVYTSQISVGRMIYNPCQQQRELDQSWKLRKVSLHRNCNYEVSGAKRFCGQKMKKERPILLQMGLVSP